MATDFELLEAWRGGSNQAGAELFDRHFAAVARFFRNKTSSQTDDLIQTTFLRTLETRDRFRGDSSFRTYLFAVAHNVLREHYRSKRRDGDRLDFGVTSVQEMGPGAVTMLARRGEEQLLLQALRAIPLEHQVLLELYFWEKMTAGEIGQVLDVPEGTIRTRIRRAKQLLNEQLEVFAETPDLLQTTLSGLEDWADALREQLGKAEPAPEPGPE